MKKDQIEERWLYNLFCWGIELMWNEMHQVKNITWRNNYWIKSIRFWDQFEENKRIVYEGIRFWDQIEEVIMNWVL